MKATSWLWNSVGGIIKDVKSTCNSRVHSFEVSSLMTSLENSFLKQVLATLPEEEEEDEVEEKESGCKMASHSKKC